MLCSIPIIGQLTMYIHSASPTGVIESRPVPVLRTTATHVSSESSASDFLRRPVPEVLRGRAVRLPRGRSGPVPLPHQARIGPERVVLPGGGSGEVHPPAA